jgi:ABC-type branched-subunit amino acid transport system permease subunit
MVIILAMVVVDGLGTFVGPILGSIVLLSFVRTFPRDFGRLSFYHFRTRCDHLDEMGDHASGGPIPSKKT